MRSREGPLLAVGCLGATLAVLAIVVAAASSEPGIGGAGTIALGALITLSARHLAEVFRHLSWPPLPWPVWVAVGLVMVVAGVVRIHAG